MRLYHTQLQWYNIRGGSRGGAPPLKLEKIWFFGTKSWFFKRNTPKIFAPPSAIGKNMIFWRKIVIFHTKYPQNFRNFFKCAPLTWNPGSAPEHRCLNVVPLLQLYPDIMQPFPFCYIKALFSFDLFIVYTIPEYK